MSLLEPWYLLGLLGLLLPWLLHRFSHHEPPVQAFPTTQFLEPTDPPATSKRKLRYWLLMALRLLLLAILCFLFAQPWLRSLNDSANAESVQLVVVDTSFSMRAQENWDKAQDEVNTVLSELPEGDAVQLFSYAGQLNALTDITTDLALVRSALSQASPGYEAADYGELMRRIDRVAGDIDKPVLATFISDTQRSNLPVQMNTLLASQLDSFSVVSVREDAPVNYYIRADAVSSDSVLARVSVTVSASEVTAGSATTAVQKRVIVTMNDRQLAVQDVLLAPGETQTLQFDGVSLPTDTDALMSVAFAQEDYFNEDDQVNVPVRGLSNLEVVLTSIGGSLNEQAQVFLSTALETGGDVKVLLSDANSALAPSVRHAVVFVDDPKGIPDSVLQFVGDGGNALVLPRIGSFESQSTVGAEAIGISAIDLPHALALGDINWFETRFYAVPVFKLEDDDRVLLGLDSGQPLLIERTVGELGRLLILNDTLDGFNSDLPLQPAFVQLMQQVMVYFNESNALPAELKVGRDLFLPANTQILNPAGDAMLDLDQLSSTSYVRITEPGVYAVLGANSNDSVSAVLNPIESNMSGLTDTEITAWQSRHDANNAEPDTSNEAGNTSTNTSIAQQMKDTQSLWRWLIPALLLFVLVETLMANRLLWVRRDGL